MRLLLTGLLLTSLTACAASQSSDAVRDATAPLRRAHAATLLASDVPAMRDSGERLLTALACGWGEDACPN